MTRSVGFPLILRDTLPCGPEPAILAPTIVARFVISCTIAESSVTCETLPISPCWSLPSPLAATTGIPLLTPSIEPLLIPMCSYQSNGDRTATRTVIGL